MNLREKIASILAVSLLINTFAFIGNAAAAQQIKVRAFDSVAGFETVLRADNASAFEQFNFLITKPDGQKLQIPAQANSLGQTELKLYDYHTKKAGIYFLEAQNPYTGTLGDSASFEIFPDEISLEKSTVESERSSLRADGYDSSVVKVVIQDQFGNGIGNRLVNLVSSRKSDKINKNPNTRFTNENGEIFFSVSSSESGISTYSAVDLSDGSILDQRVKIAYISSNPQPLSNVGGDFPFYSSTLHAQSPAVGPVNSFIIKNIPPQVEPNKSYSFRVEATDANGNKVNNYGGTVRFTVTDPNASIPPDYSFKDSDLGAHDFSLALRFVTPGTHKVGVVDTQNPQIKGEFSVVVAGASQNNLSQSGNNQTTNTNQSNSSSSNNQSVSGNNNQSATAISTGVNQRTSPTINSPVAGTYRKKDVVLSGTAGAGDQLIIFDNDTSVGQVSADGSGRFSFELKNLSQGDHKLRVGLTDGTGRVLAFSSSVDIKIDTNAPGIDEVKVFPRDTVTKGTSVLIKVYSDRDVAEAAIIMNNKIYELTKVLSEPGAYSVSLPAPATLGNYPVDVIIIDKLGNEANSTAAITLKVVQDSTFRTADNDTATPATPFPAVTSNNINTDPDAPSKPLELKSIGSDSRVTLTWEASTDNTYITKYKVFYGIEADNLIVSVNTFDAATRWYIPNLTNGQTYFFAVAGIDSDGKTGSLSEVVEGKPASGVPAPVFEGSNPVTDNTTPTTGVVAGENAGITSPAPTASLQPSPSPTPVIEPPIHQRTPETGPEAAYVILVSVLLSSLAAYYQLNKNEKAAEFYSLRLK